MGSAISSIRSIDAPRSMLRPVQGGGARLPFYALMFFTFLFVVVPQELFPMLLPLHLPFCAALFAVGSYVVDRVNRARPLTVSEPEIRLVFLLLGFALLSVPTSYWPGGSLSSIVDMFGKSIIIFLLLANVLTTAQRLRAMLWLLALCSTVPAVAVIHNYLAGNLMQLEARVQGYAGSLSSNPNDAALTLNIIIPLAIGLLLCTRNVVQRLLLGIVIALAVGGVIVTLSRGGFIFLGTTAVLYLTQRKLRVWLIPAILLLLLYMNGVDGFFDRMGTIGDVTTPGSAQERWDGMKKAFVIMTTHPVFGVGFGQNMLALNTMGTKWARVHNVYLEIGAELGIPALIVYLLLLRHCLRSIRGAAGIWRARRLDLYYLAQGLQISLIGFAIAVNFYPVAYHFSFYYLAGLAVATKVLARRTLSPSQGLAAPS